MFLFVSGDRSGVGKSTVCMALLSFLISDDGGGFERDEIAYIKPCTQCEEVQLCSKFCERNGIAHRGVGPVRFYKGFTSKVIKGEAGSVEERLRKIRKAVDEIGAGKRLVLIDGVGYCSVGSVAGVSNADVARLLGAPVLIVGRPGLGNAIDSFNLMRVFFEHHHVSVLGAVFNNVPDEVSYHTFENSREMVRRYFADRGCSVSYYGHVRRNADQWNVHEARRAITKGVACILRETSEDLAMTTDEEAMIEHVVKHVREHMDMPLLLRDVQTYYQQQDQQKRQKQQEQQKQQEKQEKQKGVVG